MAPRSEVTPYTSIVDTSSTSIVQPVRENNLPFNFFLYARLDQCRFDVMTRVPVKKIKLSTNSSSVQQKSSAFFKIEGWVCQSALGNCWSLLCYLSSLLFLSLVLWLLYFCMYLGYGWQ